MSRSSKPCRTPDRLDPLWRTPADSALERCTEPRQRDTRTTTTDDRACTHPRTWPWAAPRCAHGSDVDPLNHRAMPCRASLINRSETTASASRIGRVLRCRRFALHHVSELVRSEMPIARAEFVRASPSWSRIMPRPSGHASSVPDRPRLFTDLTRTAAATDFARSQRAGVGASKVRGFDSAGGYELGSFGLSPVSGLGGRGIIDVLVVSPSHRRREAQPGQSPAGR